MENEKKTDSIWQLSFTKIRNFIEITKIQKEYGQVVKDMVTTVEEWKAAEGDRKAELLEKLRALTAQKKDLLAQLDDAVGLKDVHAELAESVVNEANDMSVKKLSKYTGFKEDEYERVVYAFKSKELGKMQFQAEPSFTTIDGNFRDDELHIEVDRRMANIAHAKVLGQIRGYKNIIAFLKGGGAEKYESGSLKEIEKYLKKFDFKSISESKLHESMTVAQKFKALM